MDQHKDLRIKNSYSDENERVSFQIEIHSCADKSYCKSDDDIANLLEKIYFTFYNLEENVEFGNPLNIGKRPIRAIDAFHS